MRLLIIIFFLYSCNESSAAEPYKVMQMIRCTTCNGQSILESETDNAKILRKEVLSLAEQGMKDEEILEIMRSKYGNYVVFAPKFDIDNIFIWLVPFILLLLGIVYFWKTMKHLPDKHA